MNRALKQFTLGLIAILALSFVTISFADEPYFADLSKIANSDIEDDGVADNGKGGWSDEGVNDMFVYPPLPTGDIKPNGYSFRVLDAKKNNGKCVVLLAGKGVSISYPKSVKIDVDSRKAKYLYFMQSCLRGSGESSNYTVATYTLTYDDGTTADMPIRNGLEIRPWWTKQWYDNSGEKSWPVHMGQNLYSAKWRSYIGVFAMQWTNPHPEKAISSITLSSEGNAVPAIFAITLSNEDFYKNPDVKKDYKRPDIAPAGYFDSKQSVENKLLFQAMIKEGHAQGIRELAIYRRDVLAVTVDPTWGEIGAGLGEKIAAAHQAPACFTLTSEDDPAYKEGQQPVKVGRFSFERWNGNIGTFPQNVLYWHTYYLHLPKPLTAGKTYSVALKDMGSAYAAKAQLTYDPAKTITPAIKVNQVAYSSQSKRRYAYLGWWAGDSGAIDYAAYDAFQVVNEKTGDVVLAGKLTLRAKADKLSGEDVYEMDLASLKPGQYHIVIANLARSDSFGVGGPGIAELYKEVNRAFYHQRCGIALTAPYTTFTRPACHTKVYKSGRVAGATDDASVPNEPIRTFKYGYHDAADFDVFTYHLRATAQTLTAYAMFPKAFADGDLNIPESGNKLSDILDEADWALRGYLELQQPDGAIPLGRGNDEDYIRGLRTKGQNPEYGILPPETSSCAEYAAVAAYYARLIKPFDAKRASEYTASAIRALDWALQHKDVGPHDKISGTIMTLWAAAELFSTTGEKRFHDEFLDLYKQGAISKSHWSVAALRPQVSWPYILCTQPDVDKSVQAELRKQLLLAADDVVKQTDLPAYRMGAGMKDGGLGWGTGNGGGHYADVCLRAFVLTGKQSYLDAACLNADFQLGANPLSKTFITGMGVRPPWQPQISAFLYTGPNKTGTTVKGVTIFGIGSRVTWYPSDIPFWRCYRDIGNGGAEVCSEFTVTETMGASSILYSVLEAMEKQPGK